jgi:hypothetical protein
MTETTDKYPQNIDIEIDHNVLSNYLRTKWFLSWFSSLSFFGCLFGFATVTDSIDKHKYDGINELLLLIFQAIGVGFLCSTLISIILYFIFSHRLAVKMATSLKIRVEGPFLRIIQTGSARIDRKLHFRSIVDYSTVEGSLMRRFGVMALQMTTTGGGVQSNFQVIGIKNCLQVRDMLAIIDSVREQ